MIVLNVIFWCWCGLLALLAVLFFLSARGLSAEAGGAGMVFAGAFAALLLLLSLAARGLIWLL